MSSLSKTEQCVALRNYVMSHERRDEVHLSRALHVLILKLKYACEMLIYEITKQSSTQSQFALAPFVNLNGSVLLYINTSKVIPQLFTSRDPYLISVLIYYSLKTAIDLLVSFCTRECRTFSRMRLCFLRISMRCSMPPAFSKMQLEKCLLFFKDRELRTRVKNAKACVLDQRVMNVGERVTA